MDKQDDILNIGCMQMLTLILSENQSHKCINLLKEKGIHGGLVIIGRGTVSNAMLNLLGIKSQKKEIVNIMLKRENAKEMIDYFTEALQLAKPGHGIAYITPVINVPGHPGQETSENQAGTNTTQDMEEGSMFRKLTVIVDRGMSDDVMDVARKAGARGGTIMHGRGVGAEIETNLFGLEIEPEKELVIILIPNDLTEKVSSALVQELHLNEPGKGILFVEPVIETRGLFEMREKSE